MARQADFSEWVGRERVTEARIDVDQARKLAATLDLDPAAFRDGDPLPPGWHWIYFAPADPRSELGADGHAKRGSFIPPVPADRRMWAGGSLRIGTPLRIGSKARMESRIQSVEPKTGRSGPMWFVTIRHRIFDGGEVVLEEAQDLVYLDRGRGSRPRAEADPTEGGSPLGDLLGSFTVDETTLFRFSALTFNGHRIHYDRPFATDVEGYPALVVHGPLVALLLVSAGVETLRSPGEGTEPRGPLLFRYRALGPAFCGETIGLYRGESEEGGGLALHARVPRRGLVMRATLAVEG